jgi:hypothetical protein
MRSSNPYWLAISMNVLTSAACGLGGEGSPPDASSVEWTDAGTAIRGEGAPRASETVDGAPALAGDAGSAANDAELPDADATLPPTDARLSPWDVDPSTDSSDPRADLARNDATTGCAGSGVSWLGNMMLGLLQWCEKPAPMASGSTAFLRVSPRSLEAAHNGYSMTFSSSDPSVLEFRKMPALGSGRVGEIVRCRAHRPGTALLRPISQLIEVREVTQIELQPSAIEGKEIWIVAGQTASLALALQDAAGTELVGQGAVSCVSENATVARAACGGSELAQTLVAFMGNFVVLSNTDAVTISGENLGRTTIRVTSAGGGELALPVEVVESNAMTRLAIDSPSRVAPDDSFRVSATGFIGSDRLHGISCQWAVTAPLVIVDAGDDHVYLEGESAGQGIVTCRAGSFDASAQIVIE